MNFPEQVARAGELLGELKDYFGNVIEEIRLKEDAIILYQTISYSVPENSPRSSPALATCPAFFFGNQQPAFSESI